jgi:hypothetical protein
LRDLDADADEADVVNVGSTWGLEHDAFRFARSLNFENSWRIRGV